VRHFLDRFPEPELAPGDVLITNDPWMGTGHIHDVSTAMPLYHRGRLIAFSAVVSHMPDIGGPVRTNDTSAIYEEGLQIPRLKFLRAGIADPVVREFIATNVRVPDETLGDLWGQVAAHKMLEARLAALLDESGVAIEALGAEIRGRSEQALRQAIARLPDGQYRYVVAHDGFEAPLIIDCKVSVEGDRLVVDYDGTSPQVPNKAINVVEAYTFAYSAFPLKALLAPNVPNNEGSFIPIEVKAPPGSVLNARHPAATAARGQVGHMLPVAILGALGQALPGRVSAEGSGNSSISIVGRDAGRPFAVASFVNAGQGATAGRPGRSALSFPSNLGNTPIEVLEAEAPVLVHHRRLRRGSGGRGRHPGGDGIDFAFEYRGEAEANCAFLMTRRVVPPKGAGGGGDGRPAEIRLNGETVDPIRVKRLAKGDRVDLATAGGGGFGPPE
jgi:N-methylhydantoinase B